MAIYVVLEGTEGVGKTTQTHKLAESLRQKGYSVLQTKEPGTPLSPLTMELRNIMLNAKYESEITKNARELISQAIRSIHIERVVAPANKEYDFIVQDRGILSGFAYGEACGNNINWLQELTLQVNNTPEYQTYYDVLFLLKGNVENGLNTAISGKQEFLEGDAIEKMGLSFMNRVSDNMEKYSKLFNTSIIHVDGRSIEDISNELLKITLLKAQNEKI